MKERLYCNLQVLLLGFAFTMFFLLVIYSNYVYASTIGNPFYEEHYEAKLGKPEMFKSFTGNFTGHGILNGNLNVSAEVNFVQTFRDNDTAFGHGNVTLITENGDTAVYKYDAFTNYNSDGSSQGSGAAIFDDGATGELSFLSNTVGIYKNFIDSVGNGTFQMWQWK